MNPVQSLRERVLSFREQRKTLKARQRALLEESEQKAKTRRPFWPRHTMTDTSGDCGN